MNPEKIRLETQSLDKENWRLWGPYLSERSWGTVREDYSANGDAWNFFPHEHARSRAYRWGEDGMAGICDEQQRLCLALALWNGRDPILKERAFGLTGSEGNHGEDVKEYFFYLDAAPSHSYLKYLYKYPQAEYPYAKLVEENRRRTRLDPPFSLLDTGVFAENRYWDVEITYAKEALELLVARLTVTNRGPEAASLHILPTLWFRNTWSWVRPDEEAEPKPQLRAADAGGAAWAVTAGHHTLGDYFLYGRQQAQGLFTENETNTERLFGQPNSSPYVKDAFHRRVIQGEVAAVNPDQVGTKFAAWHQVTCGPGEAATIDLVLSKGPLAKPFGNSDEILDNRLYETDCFYAEILPGAGAEDARIFRQAMAGMIWGKQFFYFNVARWLDGDQIPPPVERKRGRNFNWRHLDAADVISMPDGWEYPWFAAWDLAYHCIVLSLVDVDFAKEQLDLLLESRYLHPSGQIPAYEWSFSDVNPPVHAAATLEVFRRERKQRGKGDLSFLRRVFNKLIMNYAWWLNRKDSEGQNVFEGGFLGLDNISVYDRSMPFPPGYSLKQADATGWMAMFSLNMTAIAIELAQAEPEYEDMAIQCYMQFLSIANAMGGHATNYLSLWDPVAGFFKDLMLLPDGSTHRIDAYSYVGLIPLFASEVEHPAFLAKVPRFSALLEKHAGGMFDTHIVCACPVTTNDQGEHLLSLADDSQLPRILYRLLDETQFLSDYGIRGLSRIHAEPRATGIIPGVEMALIEYEPGESKSDLFGGNSNWRGPIWLPINYFLLRALSRFHQYLGPDFKVALPGEENKEVNLEEAVGLIAERLVNIFRRNEQGVVPAHPPHSPFENDPHWQDLCLFYEYYHGDTGQGLGASHQTGWSGLVANLIKRKHPDQPSKWSRWLGF
jgi:hypothetical protein